MSQNAADKLPYVISNLIVTETREASSFRGCIKRSHHLFEASRLLSPKYDSV